jgi:hypothetical protein
LFRWRKAAFVLSCIPERREMSEETIAPNEYQPRLLIYVVWNPAFKRGQELAWSIYTHFSCDPERTNARGLGIPVFFRSAATTPEDRVRLLGPMLIYFESEWLPATIKCNDP